MNTGKPFVTVKRAFDADGSMIPPKGHKTFTSSESLILAHKLRKKADAILTGSGTILADRPLFSVRHVKDHENKRRILAILDKRGRVPEDYIDEARSRGFDVRIYPDLDACFTDLSKAEIQDVLVEAGPQLSRAVFASPHWTMTVDICRNETDALHVGFNPSIDLPFSVDHFDLTSLLPEP